MHPYFRIGDLVAADIAKRQKAAANLQALSAEGLLQKKNKISGRENLNINPPLLTLLPERA